MKAPDNTADKLRGLASLFDAIHDAFVAQRIIDKNPPTTTGEAIDLVCRTLPPHVIEQLARTGRDECLALLDAMGEPCDGATLERVGGVS